MLTELTSDRQTGLQVLRSYCLGLQTLSNSLCFLFQLLPARVGYVTEVRQLLSLVPRDNVNMQMKNFLTRCMPVLLYNCDAIGFCGIFQDN